MPAAARLVGRTSAADKPAYVGRRLIHCLYQPHVHEPYQSDRLLLY